MKIGAWEAVEPIGEYNVGDEVPAHKAEVWDQMYVVSPVRRVGTEEPKPASKDKDENEDFESELRAIKGIGRKTAQDVVAIYPGRESLLEAIDSGETLPVRDDVEEKLRKHFA